ncbi:MAG: F0F1 ATP synthase subunit gamma [Alphaproteobacteria bacterium]|nr:F0F1 ATP synthase subunit gamma [Alphaproteobacteria bacterium]
MPSLKDFRNRIASVKSTRKITSAMKMVAASKLRRAQQQAEASQPYASRMSGMLGRLVANLDMGSGAPLLMAGTGKDDVQLLVVMTSDRGLCGGFNGSIIRLARLKIRELVTAGKTVKLVCVGRKGAAALKRDHGDKIVKTFENLGRKHLSFADAALVSDYILDALEQGEFDVCTLVYNQFKSVIAQIPSAYQLIPLSVDAGAGKVEEKAPVDETAKALYEFEPSEEGILAELLPRNLSVQVFRALLDSAAGEQAARMTAMDNATRNAGDMISNLTLKYNRARQAYITKELIEIISGAEAV